MQQCKGLTGRLFSHNFRPIFDTVAPEREALAMRPQYGASDFVRAISLMGDRVYTGHVCTRCGYRTIKEF
ncbi:hypothetical protein [Achromobacter spanius]|uniref:hypothetical protein n=1 Tax=Achromobacter spanius TaxID=217203 RepID=UPI00382BD5FC